jgi:hypothetical protein
MWLFKNILMLFFQNLVMLCPKIIEFAPKKNFNFCTQKKVNGLASINSGCEQAQLDELTDAMGVRIDSTWSIVYH